MEGVTIILKNEAYEVVGAAMEVHSHLGPGFLESVYQEAFERELSARSVPFKRQRALEIVYKGKPLNQYYVADLICFDQIVVEIKGVREIIAAHQAQVINYLRATGLTLGLLVNFGSPSLE